MIVLDGRSLEVPGVFTLCWEEDPTRVPRIKHVTPRVKAMRAIVAHTVHGQRTKTIVPGKGSARDAFAQAKYQASTTRAASWDFTVGLDGTVLWQNDPVTAFSWHATQVNFVTVGFEMCQTDDGTMYQATIDAAARMVNFLCGALGIQRQTPWDSLTRQPFAGHLYRLDPGRAGIDCVGVYGHRNLWTNNKDGALAPARGYGDPGDALFHALVDDYGFETFSYNAKEDLKIWRDRQRLIGVSDDGLPLGQTRRALSAQGYPQGLWVLDKTIQAS